LKKQGKHPVSSSKFWKKIKFYEPKDKGIKTLKVGGNIYFSDEEKANLFKEILKETFNEERQGNKYDEEHHNSTTESVENEIKNTSNKERIKLFSLNELNKAIKELKNKASHGIDEVSNILLKKAPESFKIEMLKLFNQTLAQSKVPDDWKNTIIKMIPKSTNEPHNPKNYRPISLTSCIAKLCERLIANRLREILKKNKIIIKQQSGFRFKRQTKDNLAFLIQKTQESFSRKKKVAAVFFDISQAFDKVWHCGLIKKLIDHKIPIIYIKWLMEFLKHRLFCVQINSFKTNFEPISVGVPQGAVLSPLLFSLYINDIPILNIKNKSYSLLFADDLVTI
jgi:hypothetical protein